MTKAQHGRLEGKASVITGDAAGIGRSTALMFAREGARVIIIDIQDQAAHETVTMIEAAGGVGHFHHADLSKADDVNKAFEGIKIDIGPYDILFNHAGSIIVKPLHEFTEEHYDRLMDINVRSAFLVCRRALPEMVANVGGSVVITASIASELGYALEALYCMSKGAVLQLTGTIAVEYREQGIRCNAVCPGFVKTAHGLREIAELDDAGPTWEDGNLAATQGRIGEPEEVASAVTFLVSDEARFVNGHALYVDNGWYTKG